MTSQLLGIDSSVPARGCVWTRSQSRIHQRLGTSAILIARTQDTWHESTCAREHVRRCQGGGRRRGFRCTMQAEAYIVIIIISPLDIKDLSFSLFASLSLLLPFPWPLTGTSFSLLLSLSPLSFTRLSASPFRAASVSSLARSVLLLLVCLPCASLPCSAWLWCFREMTICKLLRHRLSLTTILAVTMETPPEAAHSARVRASKSCSARTISQFDQAFLYNSVEKWLARGSNVGRKNHEKSRNQMYRVPVWIAFAAVDCFVDNCRQLDKEHVPLEIKRNSGH